MTGIIDYNTGNIRSVENALMRLGGDYVLTSDTEVLSACDRLILPGVGDAGYAMAQLRACGLDSFLKSCTMPVLGICLGMQLLCSHSEESDTDCLGIFPNLVRRFERSMPLKVPHVGWNDITGLDPILYDGVPEGSYVYFVHSYFAEINEDTASVTTYGIPFSSSLRKGNFMGCQFHPEKSGDVGEKILSNFLKMKP